MKAYYGSGLQAALLEPTNVGESREYFSKIKLNSSTQPNTNLSTTVNCLLASPSPFVLGTRNTARTSYVFSNEMLM